MKNKVVCPCCGYPHEIEGFLKWLESYTQVVTCNQCHGNVELSMVFFSYQSYKIEISNKTKYYTVKTYNEPDSVIIVVGFKNHKWSRQQKIGENFGQREIRKVIDGLKEMVVEASSRHHREKLDLISIMAEEEIIH